MIKTQEFIQKIGENLFETREDLSEDTKLDTLKGWDSVGRLCIVALFHELFGQVVDRQSLKECKTIGDIMGLAGNKQLISKEIHKEDDSYV